MVLIHRSLLCSTRSKVQRPANFLGSNATTTPFVLNVLMQLAIVILEWLHLGFKSSKVLFECDDFVDVEDDFTFKLVYLEPNSTNSKKKWKQKIAIEYKKSWNIQQNDLYKNRAQKLFHKKNNCFLNRSPLLKRWIINYSKTNNQREEKDWIR